MHADLSSSNAQFSCKWKMPLKSASRNTLNTNWTDSSWANLLRRWQADVALTAINFTQPRYQLMRPQRSNLATKHTGHPSLIWRIVAPNRPRWPGERDYPLIYEGLNSSRVLGGQKEGRPSFALLSTIYAGMQSVGNTANAATRAEKNVEGTNLAPCLFAEIMECQIWFWGMPLLIARARWEYYQSNKNYYFYGYSAVPAPTVTYHPVKSTRGCR